MTAFSDREAGYSHDERLTRVEVQVANLTGNVALLTTAQTKLTETVQGRPSWIMAALLSLSTATNGALLTALVTVLAAHK